jgi:predicted MFS family arabinose efflux permease
VESSARPPRSLELLTTMLAVACGLTVANLYYAQPLLHLLSTELQVSQGTASIVVTATQLGYATGLALVVPLGDLFENRKLICRTLVFTALALAVAAAAPNFGVFVAMSVLVGTTSVVAQILVPFAAHLAPDDERGRVVGRVMSGLILGILLARTLASLVAAAWGWRAIYAISAGLMIVLALMLWRLLPERRAEHTAGYGSLLASVVRLAIEEPILRRRALCQALMFGAFSAYWTSITFQLIVVNHQSQVAVGIFALVGAAGAAAAPVAGRLADGAHAQLASGIAIALGSVAMLVAGVGGHDVVLLAVAAVLLDLAVQGHQVLSQREIYGLRADARARINTVYMTSVFIGGAICSAVSGWLYERWGWIAVSTFGGCLPLVAFGVWAYGRVSARRAVSALA